MTRPQELRCYAYTNRPYVAVRDALRADAAGMFQRATKGAVHRGEALVTNLRMDLGGIEVGTDVSIQILEMTERTRGAREEPVTTISIAWKAARAAAIFPAMEAELAIYPLSADETQLDLFGVYRPPMGVLGSAVDALVGHRVAEACVLRFVEDVAKLLSSELPPRASV
jgi:hypothetical protein